ncbi:uncharacterized protein LOC133420784 [Cololabis saira]|uniref:uncharacterized protein LOC133420784 n=1 Tax=Cololabis saira TaxID=129043 RepID=UPI002AD1FE3F|nr:uncharacterized protein LOC133420784 [Cololabis saira]
MSHVLPCSAVDQSIMSTLKMLVLLSCWTFTGVMAKDPSETHYRLENSSVCLHVTGPPPNEDGYWTFKNRFLISHTKINPKYKEKAVFLELNLTLCIENLTESDTGSYKVTYFDSESMSRSETSHVIVQGMVPTPAMTVNTLHHSNVSSGFCNFTVNCSIQDYWLSSVCDGDGCRQFQKSFQRLNITIFSDNGNVVCSGNNHVSTSNVSKSLPTMCSNKYTHDDDDEEEQMLNPLVPSIIVLAVFTLGGACFALVKKYILKENSDNEATTAAAQLVENGPLETQPQSEPRVSTSSSEAEPSYENVDVSQLRSSGPRQEQDNWESQGVDTIYNVPRPVASGLKRDSRTNSAGLKNMQEQDPLILDSVTTNELQSPTDTETIYSLLQKT